MIDYDRRHVLLSMVGLPLATLPTVSLAANSPWPSSARGRSISRPNWVIVIPAIRTTNGALTIWDLSNEWMRIWRAPTSPNGLRLVTLNGDSADRRVITAKAIDDMILSSLDVIMQKYGAPAIALAVHQTDDVAVAAWVPNGPATWDTIPTTSNYAQDHKNAAQLMVSLFSGMRIFDNNPEIENVFLGEIVIEAIQNRGDGTKDYYLLIKTPEFVENAVRRISAAFDVIAKDPIDTSTMRITLGVPSDITKVPIMLKEMGFQVK